MRVCTVTSVTPDLHGGGSLQAHRLARSLAQAYPDLTLHHIARGPKRGVTQPSANLLVTTIPWSGALFSTFKAAILLVQELSAHRQSYDVVHFHGLSTYAYPALLAAHSMGKCTVVKISLPGEDDPVALLQRLPARTGRLLLQAIDHYTYPGKHIRTHLHRALVPSQNHEATWIPNSVNTTIFRPPAYGESQRIRRDLNLSTDAFLVGVLGAIEPRKGLVELLDTWETFAHQAPQARLALIGPVPERPGREGKALLDRVYGLSADRTSAVLPLGPTKEPQVVLRALDLYLHTSLTEGFPNAVLEAMATGLPCVVPKTSWSSELESSASRVAPVDFYCPATPGSLLARLNHHAHVASGPNAHLGQRARAYALSHHSLDAVLPKYYDLYQRLAPRSAHHDAR